MGISTTTNRVGYLGNGTSAAFAFQYEFHSTSDLDVHIWNSARVIAGVAKVLNTDYTVSGTTDAQGRYINGGTVIFNSTPAVGDQIIIYRDMPASNPFRLGYNQSIPTQELDKALDRLTMIEQRLNDLASRSVRLHDSFPGTSLPSLPDRLLYGQVLIVGSSGNTIQTAFIGSSTPVYIVIPGANDTPLLGSTLGDPTFRALPLSSNSSVTGVLAQDHGGTGTASSFPLAGVLFQEGASTVGFVPSSDEGYVLTAHGSSAPTFAAANISPVAGSSVVSNVTLGPSIHNHIVLANSSGYNIRLFDAVGNGGRRVLFSKASATTLAAPIVIIASGAQTIGSFGTSVNMYTRDEAWELESDNANWIVNKHYAKTVRASFGVIPITTIGASPNPIKGTVLLDRVMAGRDGSYAEGCIEYAANATGSSGTGNYLFDLSALGKFDTQQLTINNNDEGAAGSAQEAGTCAGMGCIQTTAAYGWGQVTIYNSTQIRVQGFSHNDNVGTVAGDFFGLNSAGLRYQISFRIPMFGWQP